jgi:hypothetical protein
MPTISMLAPAPPHLPWNLANLHTTLAGFLGGGPSRIRNKRKQMHIWGFLDRILNNRCVESWEDALLQLMKLSWLWLK